MNRRKIRRLVIAITIVWVFLGLLLAGLTIVGYLAKPLFEMLFAGGFVAYAVVATILFKVMLEDTAPRP